MNVPYSPFKKNDYSQMYCKKYCPIPLFPDSRADLVLKGSMNDKFLFIFFLITWIQGLKGHSNSFFFYFIKKSNAAAIP